MHISKLSNDELVSIGNYLTDYKSLNSLALTNRLMHSIFQPALDSTKLLREVASGNLLNAETFLNKYADKYKNPAEIILNKNLIKDNVFKNFNGFSALQCAAWMRDILMLEMFISYLPNSYLEWALVEFKELENKNIYPEAHFNLDEIFNAYENYIKNLPSWYINQLASYRTAFKSWSDIGILQSHLPAHVLRTFFGGSFAICNFGKLGKECAMLRGGQNNQPKLKKFADNARDVTNDLDELRNIYANVTTKYALIKNNLEEKVLKYKNTAKLKY